MKYHEHEKLLRKTFFSLGSFCWKISITSIIPVSRESAFGTELTEILQPFCNIAQMNGANLSLFSQENKWDFTKN